MAAIHRASGPKAPAPHVQKRRLLALAAYLETDTVREHWNFATFSSPSKDSIKNGRPSNRCGTTACAYGHATSIPAIRRLGLRFRRAGPGAPSLAGMSCYESHLFVYGLSMPQWQYLFLPDDEGDNHCLRPDASPYDVAERIREFVDAGCSIPEHHRAK
jgi:hypothetical protein